MPPPSASSKKAISAATGYQLKITLRGSKPPIWRRILVPGNCPLEILHHAIQYAMGWHNCHLYAFEIAGQEYTGRSPYGEQFDSDGLDTAQYLLSQVASEKSKFKYQYDFGDSWDHDILVEKIVPPLFAGTSPSAQPFSCLAGKGACPPEDCGGIYAYNHLIEVLQNPKHPEHKEMREWTGGILDPAAFDLAAANAQLSRIRSGGSRGNKAAPRP
jgi:hypothetical protein